jgi:nitrogenase molybdenum-cofactor synthesis protein NifE
MIRVAHDEQLKLEKKARWWMGKLSELLSEAENDQIKQCDNPCPFPLRVCKLFGALQYTATIKRSLPIIHGPRGCANNYKTLIDIWGTSIGIPPITLLCTALNERDVIYGGEEKLKRAIKLADETYKPDVIPVLIACSAAVIGDDVEAVIRDISKEVNAKLFPVHSEGFAYSNQGAGIDEALMGVVEYLMEEPKEKIPKSINIFAEKFAHEPGFAYPSDPACLKGTLEEIGIKLNTVVTGGSSIEEIENAPQAELNVVRCIGNGVQAAKFMEEKFGVPWIAPPRPRGNSRHI